MFFGDQIFPYPHHALHVPHQLDHFSLFLTTFLSLSLILAYVLLMLHAYLSFLALIFTDFLRPLLPLSTIFFLLCKLPPGPETLTRGVTLADYPAPACFLFGPMFAPIPMRGCVPIPVVTCAFLRWFLPQFLGRSNWVFNPDVYGHP
jgi:hypothetical protein